ncbi:MAG: hypothetical protein DME25_21810 [Verrucomicrobia bacterium]|nr:MAG: hypothetical protein DME25_21810 [Verrucomicrobiota bacterium]
MMPRNCSPIACSFLLFLAPVQAHSAQTNSPPENRAPAASFPHSARLQVLVDRAVKEALEKFAVKKLETNQIAVTLVDLTDQQKPAQAAYRGGEQIYPASVIKLFYVVAVHRWLEDGKLKETEELRGRCGT